MTEQPGRQLSRNETHDLSMIIKDRGKVLRAHVDAQAAACLADFEQKLATVYTWDHEETWKQANEEALEAVRKAQEVINAWCKERGIPRTFAPAIGLTWQGRGENALAERRAELRRVAKSSIDAMAKAAITNIERQGLDLRTQVVAMGLLSADAKMFLESLAPVEAAMRALDFTEVEKKLETEKHDRKRLYGRDMYG